MEIPNRLDNNNYTNGNIVKDKIYDERILFHPTIRAEFCVEVGADGITPVIPVTDVEHIMLENEELRNTLYTEQCTLSNHISRMISSYNKKSTSEIRRDVNKISKIHNIPAKDLYELLFSMLPEDNHLKTLQDYWKEGYLPVVSIYTELINYTLNFLNPTEVKNMIKTMKLKVKKSTAYPF